MSEKSNAVGKFVLAAVIVLAGVLPAGYVAVDFLRKDLREHQAETRTVVMELQTQTVEEIRTSAGKTTDALKNMSVSGGGAEMLASDMSELKRVTGELLAEQKAITQGLSKLLQGAVNKPVAATTPENEATYSQSIYFELGKAHGPAVNKQVTAILPDMRKHLAAGPCRIDVTGFADTVGNDLSNLKLSRARADYVRSGCVRPSLRFTALRRGANAGSRCTPMMA